jgi:cytochrome c1
LPTRSNNLVRWSREPERIKPGTAMPTLPVPEHDARDMAAYLMQLD